MKIELNKYSEDFYAWQGEIDGMCVQFEVWRDAGEWFDARIYLAGSRLSHHSSDGLIDWVIGRLETTARELLHSDISLCLGDSVVECLVPEGPKAVKL